MVQNLLQRLLAPAPAHLPDAEARLSRLCFWVLELARSDVDYGLNIPGVRIAPGRGDAHRNRLLRALAQWQQAHALDPAGNSGEAG